MILVNVFLLFPFWKGNISWYIRVWGLMIGSFLSLFLFFSPSSHEKIFSGFVFVDGLSSLLVSLTWWISFLMLLASQKSVKVQDNKMISFSFIICFLNMVLMFTFFSMNIMWFYVFFELSLVPTLILILGWGYQPERLQAGMYMMLYTITASLPLLLLILYLSNIFCSSSIIFVNVMQLGIFSQLSWVDNLLFLVGVSAFLVKLPMFSVHLWLPKAHVEAPVAGSMILAGILLKLGGYGIFRMMQFFLVSLGMVKDFIFAFGLWGGFITSMICFRQVDLKSLIAYSSIGHMSIAMAGIFSFSSWGWSGGLVLMLAHGLCSSALFCLANMTYEKSHTRTILLSKGFLVFLPSLAIWWFLFCICNMAAPPSMNLLGEILIIPSIMMNNFFIFIPFALMSFLAAVYSLYLYVATQHGNSSSTLSPFSSFNTMSSSIMFFHWVPLNLLVLKSEMISLWF
nr:TPA_asm: NADH dehydrogenase subunit 4 [Peltospira operculata]